MKQFIVLLAILPLMLVFLLQFILDQQTEAKISMINSYVYTAKEYAKQYGVDEGSVDEGNFGATGVTAYSFNILPTDEAESGNKTRGMVCALANGDNTIVIEVLNHVEPDEGMDMFINDKIAEVLDTLKIN